VINAGVAQLVERNLAKVEVAGSSLVSRSNNKGDANRPYLFYTGLFADMDAVVVELVDTQDLKSCSPKSECGFDSRPRYNRS
jgi:hypothetical protein